jgi:hypothetical protein
MRAVPSIVTGPSGEARRSGEEARGRARVAREERRARRAQVVAAAGHAPRLAARVDGAARAAQRLDHHARVVARERTRQLARAIGERRHEQRAVGDRSSIPGTRTPRIEGPRGSMRSGSGRSCMRRASYPTTFLVRSGKPA